MSPIILFLIGELRNVAETILKAGLAQSRAPLVVPLQSQEEEGGEEEFSIAPRSGVGAGEREGGEEGESHAQPELGEEEGGTDFVEGFGEGVGAVWSSSFGKIDPLQYSAAG